MTGAKGAGAGETEDSSETQAIPTQAELFAESEFEQAPDEPAPEVMADEGKVVAPPPVAEMEAEVAVERPVPEPAEEAEPFVLEAEAPPPPRPARTRGGKRNKPTAREEAEERALLEL